MTVFITQGRYTNQALKGLVAKPEDRMAEVKALIERGGGKLIAYYITFGEYDFLTIAEGSDPISTFASLAVTGASGSVTDLRTTLGFTSAEAKQAYEKANKAASQFHPAGAS